MLCMPLYKPLNDTFSGEIAFPMPMASPLPMVGNHTLHM
jgi:hypothetical protein